MKSNSFRFTDKAIKDLRPTDKRTYYHDTIEKDLVLQITPNGAKTFYLYKRIDGQPVRYKIGKPDEMKITQARDAAIKVRAMIVSGDNPQKTRKDLRAEDTIETLYKKYMSDHRIKLAHSTYESYERAWNLHLKKVFGNKKISQVSSDTIKRFHKKLAEKPYCANRTIVKRANLKDFRIHDLRHTLATYMVAEGANPFVVQRALTHKSIKSTQIYVNLGVEVLRSAINNTVNTIKTIGKVNH